MALHLPAQSGSGRYQDQAAAALRQQPLRRLRRQERQAQADRGSAVPIACLPIGERRPAHGRSGHDQAIEPPLAPRDRLDQRARRGRIGQVHRVERHVGQGWRGRSGARFISQPHGAVAIRRQRPEPRQRAAQARRTADDRISLRGPRHGMAAPRARGEVFFSVIAPRQNSAGPATPLTEKSNPASRCAW
jgi:hypothetical protein